MKGIKILKQDCDPKEAEDRGLPYITYLVRYLLDGKEHYDIAMAGKQVDLFDHYWDLYKKDFIRFDQTEGRVNPKLWTAPTQTKSIRKTK